MKIMPVMTALCLLLGGGLTGLYLISPKDKAVPAPRLSPPISAQRTAPQIHPTVAQGLAATPDARLIGTLIRSAPEKSLAWIQETASQTMHTVTQNDVLPPWGRLEIIEPNRIAFKLDGQLQWLQKFNAAADSKNSHSSNSPAHQPGSTTQPIRHQRIARNPLAGESSRQSRRLRGDNRPPTIERGTRENHTKNLYFSGGSEAVENVMKFTPESDFHVDQDANGHDPGASAE